MSVGRASAKRATLDAVALAVAFLGVDALIVAAILADLVEPMQGIVTILALAAVVLLLYRDDVAEAIAASNEKLGLAVDDEPVRRALDTLAGEEGWTVEHDFLSAHGRRIGTVVHGPVGHVPRGDAQPRVSRRAPRPSAPPFSVAPRRSRRLGDSGALPGDA